ncbi:ester cyclase [Lacimicrobium alkaliphilum]|uniref:Polyketide cyclase n=1 Tax=Lacimicrobium alkaliphilum TaxID=1526571 RepID=A0ABQ1R4Y2_9ALTE|nr:ester cyclase [Lacimicrobium alkaliphilum]GGD58375.1 polyketide cyclase [Lacimicrobium alkaliphilum]
MITNNQHFKSLMAPYTEAMYNFSLDTLVRISQDLFHPAASINFCVPFDSMTGASTLLENVYEPLSKAVPDLERRDTIAVAGEDGQGQQWVGYCGYYTGLFNAPWLGIPATGQQMHMRFHEFYRFEDNKVVEVQAIWDLPELMMQANAWPMSPSLGREWHVPAPKTQDGIQEREEDPALTQQSHQLVEAMLKSLGKYAEGGVDAMQLEQYWHPKASWYGPSGIGTGRGIRGFRQVHQRAFLQGMPDRNGDPDNGHLFSQNNYVAFTGWPGMHMTISEDGWLGIPPVNKRITMRSLDFWRNEKGMIRENWVLIDLLHVYRQIGVDVLARLRQLVDNKRC